MAPDPKVKAKATGGKNKPTKATTGTPETSAENGAKLNTSDAVVKAATLATSTASNEAVNKLVGESEAKRSARKKVETQGSRVKSNALNAANYLGGSYSW